MEYVFCADCRDFHPIQSCFGCECVICPYAPKDVVLLRKTNFRYTQEEVDKARRGYYGRGLSDAIDSQRYMMGLSDLIAEHMKVSPMPFPGDDSLWPSVLYANPADFFDDNQVIDA